MPYAIICENELQNPTLGRDGVPDGAMRVNGQSQFQRLSAQTRSKL